MPTIAQRYRLERVVGRGGMGEVWLAEDTVLQRQVAAKRVGARDPSPEDLARARQEAKVTAMLDDAHVVRVYDLVPDGHEQWLVMEYVESVNLAQLVRSKERLDPTTAARFVHQAALGLDAAHRAGIVHRDVKPSNLLVEASGHVKLGDFGIARLEGDVGVTRTGQLVGSPGYLAPEIATGRPATPASDLWSLGATAWFMVEGRAPYDANDGNVVGALYRIVNEPPPEPTHAGWLRGLIDHLMVHEPAERWTAQQVATYLGAALTAGGEVPAPPERIELPSRIARVDPDAQPAADWSERTTLAPTVPAQREARGEPARESPRRRRSPLTYAIGAAVLVAAVLAVVVGSLALNQRDGTRDTPSAGSSPSPSASTTQPTAAGMEGFIRDYLATAPSDPEKAFAQLTPEFQRESGELSGYSGFWGTIASARATRIEADPSGMTVAYDVDYRLDDGSRRSDSVRLQLTLDKGAYRIAGEG